MKRIRMGLLALAALTGIGGAFATTHRAHTAGTTYYSHLDSDGHVRWKTAKIGHCASFSSLACTITSTSDVSNVVDQYPPQHSLAGSMTTNAVFQ